PSRIPALLDETALRERARAARRELYAPMAPLLERVLAPDPLGSFRSLLTRLRGQGPPLDEREGQFVSRDGRFAILFVATRGSAFDGARQAALLDDLARRFDAISARHGGGLRLERSGASVFAVEAERSMRRDIDLVTAFGVAGVFLLFHAFFRSLR